MSEGNSETSESTEGAADPLADARRRNDQVASNPFAPPSVASEAGRGFVQTLKDTFGFGNGSPSDDEGDGTVEK